MSRVIPGADKCKEPSLPSQWARLTLNPVGKEDQTRPDQTRTADALDAAKSETCPQSGCIPPASQHRLHAQPLSGHRESLPGTRLGCPRFQASELCFPTHMHAARLQPNSSPAPRAPFSSTFLSSRKAAELTATLSFSHILDMKVRHKLLKVIKQRQPLKNPQGP